MINTESAISYTSRMFSDQRFCASSKVLLAGIFVPTAKFVLAGIFGSAANFVLAAIFVLAEIFVFCLFCCFTSQVNNYGHGETVSSPNHTFPGQA